MRKHYHFIGIGGTGLSPIARILLEQGHRVSGSDLILSPLALELQDMGAVVYEGHKAEQIDSADIVIRSSAVNDDNVEVKAARQAGIPVLKRIDFLGELTDAFSLIAIAGTHGKTTTTSMAAWVLNKLELDPSYIIGGTSKNLDKNAHAGNGDYFVIEADEYDHMFLGLTPNYLIITNVEHDHPDCYPTRQEYVQAFQDLVDRVPQEGTILVCTDDPQAYQIGQYAQENKRKVIFYGTNEKASYRIDSIEHCEHQGVSFVLHLPDGQFIEQILDVPGEHNARNASAVLALCHILGFSPEKVVQALSTFSGSKRRFDILGTFNGITLIDDYGHHPTEIEATVCAARSRYPNQRIFSVWQPHTYSRTQELFDDYLDVFRSSDVVIVTEIYKSREKEQDYSSRLIAGKIHHANTKFIAELEDVVSYLEKELKDGDVVLVLSAGDANRINQDLIALLNSPEKTRREHA